MWRYDPSGKDVPLIKGSIDISSLVAGIMNAKYVNGMPLAGQKWEFTIYDLNLSTKTMANWIISCAERYRGLLYEWMKENPNNEYTIRPPTIFHIYQ